MATSGRIALVLERLSFRNGEGTEQSSGATRGGAIWAEDARLTRDRIERGGEVGD